MNCPVDGSELVITDRQGIEIDYCPQCRGVWLDRGELDKIIERAAAYDLRGATAATRARPYDDDDDDDDDRRALFNPYGKSKNDDRYGGDPRYYERRNKRRSFLKEVFDIFD